MDGDGEQARALRRRDLDPGEPGLTQPRVRQMRRPGIGQRREGEVVGMLEQQQAPAGSLDATVEWATAIAAGAFTLDAQGRELVV